MYDGTLQMQDWHWLVHLTRSLSIQPSFGKILWIGSPSWPMQNSLLVGHFLPFHHVRSWSPSSHNLPRRTAYKYSSIGTLSPSHSDPLDFSAWSIEWALWPQTLHLAWVTKTILLSHPSDSAEVLKANHQQSPRTFHPRQQPFRTVRRDRSYRHIVNPTFDEKSHRYLELLNINLIICLLKYTLSDERPPSEI